MAKDRFSNQKPINYSYKFKYGKHTDNNHYTIPNRKSISSKARKFILYLIGKCKYDGTKVFLRSILANGKEPTKLQRKSILKIWNKIE